MKTIKNLILWGVFGGALLTAAAPNTAAQAPAQPADKPAAEAGGKEADNQRASPPAKEEVSPKNQAPQTAGAAAPANEGKPTQAPPPAAGLAKGESELRLNFRGVP